MRKTTMLLAAAALILAACTSGPPLPPASPAPSASPADADAASPTVPPDAMVIGTCTIVANTSCPGANLTTAPLAGANLKGADLKGANLLGADLRGADLRGADLTDADLRNSDLTGADLKRATVEGAFFKDANLFQATFNKSDVVNGQIKKALRCETILANGHEDNSNCGDSPISPPPAPAGAKPTISKFLLPDSVTCADGKSEITVRAKFAVENAKTITFDVDDEPLADEQTFKSSDTSARLPFECKAKKHTYTLIASDSQDNTASEKQTVRRA